MGDMTDWILEHGLGDCDDECGEERSMQNQDVECRYCGQGGLFWKETERGWRLFHLADGFKPEIHICDQYVKERKP